MKIAVFGGTFNPPHNGHVFAVKELLKEFDSVWVMVANTPNKSVSELAPASDRLKMAKRAFGFSRAEVCDDEIRRGGVSYTCDTLAELEEKYPEHEFYWAIGSDLLEELSQWKNCQELYLKNFVVIFRPYVAIERALLAPFKNPKVIRAEGIEMSSTKLREWIKSGNLAEAEKFLPASVLEYVKEKKRYV